MQWLLFWRRRDPERKVYEGGVLLGWVWSGVAALGRISFGLGTPCCLLLPALALCASLFTKRSCLCSLAHA